MEQKHACTTKETFENIDKKSAYSV